MLTEIHPTFPFFWSMWGQHLDLKTSHLNLLNTNQTSMEFKFWLGCRFNLEPELLSPYFLPLSNWLPGTSSFSLIYKSSRYIPIYFIFFISFSYYSILNMFYTVTGCQWKPSIENVMAKAPHYALFKPKKGISLEVIMQMSGLHQRNKLPNSTLPPSFSLSPILMPSHPPSTTWGGGNRVNCSRCETWNVVWSLW